MDAGNATPGPGPSAAAADPVSPPARRLAALSRRALLGGIAATSASAVAAAVPASRGTVARASQDVPMAATGETATAATGTTRDVTAATARHERAYEIRVRAAASVNTAPLPAVPRVTDDERSPDGSATFSKALPHDLTGVVNPFAHQALVQALASGNPADFEQIPMGGTVKLVNPQAGLGFDLLGPDAPGLTVAPAPAFASAQTASEFGELLWQALARDIPFLAYPDDPLIATVAADLTRFSDFRGPKIDRVVTPATLFRATLPGLLSGPFVSQFLLHYVPIGVRPLDQRIQTTPPLDYLTTFDEWLAIQNGELTPAATHPIFDPTPRYIRNGRDLAAAVHRDLPGQAALNALMIAFGTGSATNGGMFGTAPPLNPSNPYLGSQTQDGFGTFGLAHATHLVTAALNSALKAAWYQKWFVHRRLRPEAYGGRVHQVRTSGAAYPIHDDLLRQSVAVAETEARFGTALLPQAFAEGAPAHPAYPSGHATWAGATVTMLKAFLDEAAIVVAPVEATPDGTELVPYTGPDRDGLTLGGELNKLAWNIAIGRNFAGIHWRSDAAEGLTLGETVAIALLTDLRQTYNEAFGGYTFTTFAGSTVTI